MGTRSIAETIIALETAALEAWLNGNPTPYLDLYSNDFTYFDPVHEKRLDGWQTVRELYESMRGQVTMDTFELIDPVVQSTDTMAVLTYNLQSYAVKRFGKRTVQKCISLKKNTSAESSIAIGH